MTRFLSESLQAHEPSFSQGLKRLEIAHGHPSADIKLSTRVLHGSQAKIAELGLDPKDTTPEELYHVLAERMRADDARLTKALRTHAATHISAEADVVAGMVHALKAVPGSKECFALKGTTVKALIKKLPPKKAMKQLGYRSMASFLKHETAVSILAAAWLSESTHWQQQFVGQYKKLQPADFELRKITILHPRSKRWQDLAQKIVADKKHNLLSFKELGAIVLLPLPRELPAGAVTASLSLALHELNEIRVCSTFLKLCQVRPDFGSLVLVVASDEPQLNSEILDRPVPWRLIQRYYARISDSFREEVFGPHIRAEDMSWQPVEEVLSHIEPSFSFWHGSDHLGILHNHRPVSLNVVDAALNLCNQIAFEQRITQAYQRSLWHELMMHYLKHDTVEQTVLTQLQPQLAAETVTA